MISILLVDDHAIFREGLKKIIENTTGMEVSGEADNGDKAATVSELHNYIKKNVHDTTKSLYADLPQTPQLFTHKPDRVLFRLP